MLDRKKVVESLQSNRTEAVRLLDQLVRQLPDGLYLKSIKQTGDVVNVIGYATSNARVSTLMRNFEASPWLEDPKLVEIKAVKLGNANVNEFTLNVKLTRPEGRDAGRPPPSLRRPTRNRQSTADGHDARRTQKAQSARHRQLAGAAQAGRRCSPCCC